MQRFLGRRVENSKYTIMKIYYFLPAWRSKTLVLCFSLFLYFSIDAQILISPTGDGGFETGNTFAANNWSTAQTANGNKWQVGTAAGAQSPTRAAYIGSALNNGGISGSKVVHFFRDVAIPAGATNVLLSFYVKQTVVDNTYDYLRVFTTTPANTPQSGTMPGTGYTKIYENTATQYNNFTAITPINLTALAGTTVRLVFTFKSDGWSPNANPAIDNISLTYSTAVTCPTPTAPTNLQLVPASTTSVNGSFTAPATLPSGFMVIRSTSATAPTITDGTVYNTGTTFQTSYYAIRGSNTNDLATSFTDTGLIANTTYNYYVYSFNNACSGTKPKYSVKLTGYVKTSIVKYCTPNIDTPQTNASFIFIDKVSFIGTLNDFTKNSTSSNNPLGYQDFTAEGPATQIQGESINIFVSNSGDAANPPVGDATSIYKAWIDLNNDGDFNDTVNGVSEKIYDSGDVYQTSSTFGFLIPENLPPGNYRLRIRIGYSRYDISYNLFGSCGTTAYGETEDYTLKVLEKCVAKITGITNGVNCGTGEVTMSVTTENADSVKWYTTPTGGNAIATTPVNANSSIYSPDINADAVYYVSAYNAAKDCEYQIRKPVRATVKILPTISFSVSSPEICGDANTLKITAAGGNQIEYLVDEDFEPGNLGVFKSVKLKGDTSNNNNAKWTNYSSSYQPLFGSWNPVISSGFKGNHFAMTVSDLGQNGAQYRRGLELIDFVNTENFTNLNIKFRVYFSKYYDPGTTEYVVVQGLFNGTWEDLADARFKLITDTGNGNKFAEVSAPLNPKYLNRNDIKIRIVYVANWNDGVAVDDVQLYGEKSMLNAAFAFYGSAIGIYTDEEGTVGYNDGDFVTEVYVKPDEASIEDNESWIITATAVLKNGCSADGDIVIQNNTKVWNNPSTQTNWATAADWKPSATPAVPAANKCVIIKTPVEIGVGTEAVAKNIKIETTAGSTGNLDIFGSLTVTDFVSNDGSPDNLTVKSNGNLIQLNATAPNSGSIKAERYVTDMDNVLATQMDYVYWSAPVTGQITKGTSGFSPGTPPNRFFTYRESNDNFYETGDPTFVPGKGYAVQAETLAPYLPNVTGYNKTYNFRGTPNNGDISINIIRTADAGQVQHGFNLVGNPYPSNIDFDKLYTANSGKIFSLAYFWTNNNYEISQQGSSYSGNNYAVYNEVGGNPATHSASGSGMTAMPNGIIKVGQGFIIQKRDVSGPVTLDFKNSYGSGQDLRVSNSGTFFQKEGTEKNRFWLSLTSPSGLVNTQLIGYISGATNMYEQDYDAEILGMSSDLFYSKAGDKKLLIQGKGDFEVTDKVILGANCYSAGNYIIELDTTEGIFAAGQKIYLKDKEAGVIANLSEGSYTFASSAGLSEGRFEIVYKPETVLATDGTSKEELIVYRSGNDFIADAKNSKITGVEVYDTAGRLIYTKRTNAAKVIIPAEKLPNSIYVLKIEYNGIVKIRKILK